MLSEQYNGLTPEEEEEEEMIRRVEEKEAAEQFKQKLVNERIKQEGFEKQILLAQHSKDSYELIEFNCENTALIHPQLFKPVVKRNI